MMFWIPEQHNVVDGGAVLSVDDSLVDDLSGNGLASDGFSGDDRTVLDRTLADRALVDRAMVDRAVVERALLPADEMSHLVPLHPWPPTANDREPPSDRQPLPADEAVRVDAGALGAGRAEAPALPPASAPDGCPEILQELDCCPPWTIAEVHAAFNPLRITVWAESKGVAVWPCPACGEPVAVVGLTEVYHVFRCLTRDDATFVHVRIPLIECPAHGRQPVAVPWGENARKWRHVRTIVPGQSGSAW